MTSTQKLHLIKDFPAVILRQPRLKGSDRQKDKSGEAKRLPRAQDGLFGSRSRISGALVRRSDPFRQLREHAKRFPGAQEDRFCSREVAELLPGAQEDRFCSREHAERFPVRRRIGFAHERLRNGFLVRRMGSLAHESMLNGSLVRRRIGFAHERLRNGFLVRRMGCLAHGSLRPISASVFSDSASVLAAAGWARLCRAGGRCRRGIGRGLAGRCRCPQARTDGRFRLCLREMLFSTV